MVDIDKAVAIQCYLAPCHVAGMNDDAVATGYQVLSQYSGVIQGVTLCTPALHLGTMYLPQIDLHLNPKEAVKLNSFCHR